MHLAAEHAQTSQPRSKDHALWGIAWRYRSVFKESTRALDMLLVAIQYLPRAK